MANRMTTQQLMERPLTATDLKSIDNMIYADTDSIKRHSFYELSVDEKRYLKNDVLATKDYLNSIYGRANMMNTNKYIVIHTDHETTAIVFKDKIVGVDNDNGKACLLVTTGDDIRTKDDFALTIKQLI